MSQSDIPLPLIATVLKSSYSAILSCGAVRANRCELALTISLMLSGERQMFKEEQPDVRIACVLNVKVVTEASIIGRKVCKSPWLSSQGSMAPTERKPRGAGY